MRKRTGIFFALFAIGALWAARAAAAPVEVSISFFHDQLASHGRWVATRSYGSCWVPSGVAVGWEPYVDGEWVYSDYGWTWVADDPWGDIPYHYGTWAWVDPYGWVWVPGTVWAPAWVTWAYTDDYIGWAPVPPSFSITASGYFGPPVVVTATRYVFVPAPRFVGVRVASVRVPPQQGVTIVQHAVKTTRFEVGNGVVRLAGPPPAHVERAIGRSIPRVQAASLRVRPTSLAAAGVTESKTVRVVAPEKERARLAPERAEARPAQETRGAPQKEARSATTSKHAPSTSQHDASAAKREVAPRETSAKQEPKPKAKVEHHSVEPEKAKASAGKPHPQPQAQPKDNESVRESSEVSRPRPESQAQKRSDPRASVDGEHASRPAEQKPKEKPKPVKEKERPPKDSPDAH